MKRTLILIISLAIIIWIVVEDYFENEKQKLKY